MRRRSLWPLALAPWAAGLSAAQAQTVAGSGTLPLRLLRTGDLGALPLIEMELQGAKTRWLVDSGSTAALVTPALAERLQLHALGSLRVAMAGGVQTLRRYRLPPLPGAQAESKSEAASEAIAVDLARLLGPVGVQVDGALGAPWLRERKCRFDFARSELRWSGAAGAAPASAAVLPLRWDAGLPVLRLAIGARVADEFVFDTGNAGALVVFARRAQALLDGAATLPETTVRELAGSVRARYALVEQLSAPGWIARQVPAALESGEAARRGQHFDRLAGSLGVALFEPGAVSLDGPGSRLIVELPGLPEPAPLPGGFGFRLESGTSLIVSAVIGGGPAAAAGVVVGDQVQAIDDADARQWSAGRAWDALAGREAAVLHLYRDNASHRVELKRERFFPRLQ